MNKLIELNRVWILCYTDNVQLYILFKFIDHLLLHYYIHSMYYLKRILKLGKLLF